MEIDGGESSSKGEEEKTKAVVVILVGAPGSGKSTFCDHVMRASARPWIRICQDNIGNGKAGTKNQCLMSATSALKNGKSVFIDRCNIDREQRADFVKLGSAQIDVHAVVLDLPAKLCISRSVKRTGHEGNLQGGKAAMVVNRMLQKKEFPKLSEGFSRITFCHNENDVQIAIITYSSLGPLDTLSSGCFGQKNPDAKVQLGIMKFLKKVDAPPNTASKGDNSQSVTTEIPKEHEPCPNGPEDIRAMAGREVKESEDLVSVSVDGTSLNDVPTLAFPSISTADFRFDLEKASDIIVEKVEEFVTKISNGRLVLVDLSHGSKILTLVRAKAGQKNIDSSRFQTVVGNITRLYSEGGLHCNVIANAANWRLKPGGGGVNAAIFSAAGPSLDTATKERAGSLTPGKALVVPLPSTSPLFGREGVTHVIHVLGPNMNPQRPNCLDNDYVEGCKILREAYSSLFEGFASIVSSQQNLCKERSEKLGSSISGSPVLHFETSHANKFSDTDQKVKRDGVCTSESNKKSKGSEEEPGFSTPVATYGKENAKNEKNNSSMSKAWGPWSQSLYRIAMHPERHKNDVMEVLDEVVVLKDIYPKAKRHLLVVACSEGLDQLADVRKEHLPLLRKMHAVGLKWCEKCLTEDESLVFRLGYHTAPSMRQLHLHVISQDFDSNHLRNKKHWNSFNTPFFRDSVGVIKEIDENGRATLKDVDNLLSMELRCHRCRSAHPNIPRLKLHIGNCRAPFPAPLLQDGRLVLAPVKDGGDQ